MLDLSEHVVPRFQANNDQYRNNGMPSHVSSKLPELERRVQSKQMSVLPARILCRVQTKTTAKLWRSQDPVEASQDSVEASQDSVEASFAPPGNWIIIVIGCVSVVVCATIVYALGVILKLLGWAIENQFSAIFKCVANLIK